MTQNKIWIYRIYKIFPITLSLIELAQITTKDITTKSLIKIFNFNKMIIKVTIRLRTREMVIKKMRIRIKAMITIHLMRKVWRKKKVIKMAKKYKITKILQITKIMRNTIKQSMRPMATMIKTTKTQPTIPTASI